ncbi:hypothetical protein ADEAN_000606600 [Angomonas deanei]|uniref:Uncharacterized protein n=1 Tax=Angomonas deanei TaxID=59799 RepID=A0A7G2CGV8_9TRYP|nr:hypothetical protein ADEAN_000606600 [Angomonas deanei]
MWYSRRVLHRRLLTTGIGIASGRRYRSAMEGVPAEKVTYSSVGIVKDSSDPQETLDHTLKDEIFSTKVALQRHTTREEGPSGESGFATSNSVRFDADQVWDLDKLNSFLQLHQPTIKRIARGVTNLEAYWRRNDLKVDLAGTVPSVKGVAEFVLSLPPDMLPPSSQLLDVSALCYLCDLHAPCRDVVGLYLNVPDTSLSIHLLPSFVTKVVLASGDVDLFERYKNRFLLPAAPPFAEDTAVGPDVLPVLYVYLQCVALLPSRALSKRGTLDAFSSALVETVHHLLDLLCVAEDARSAFLKESLHHYQYHSTVSLKRISVLMQFFEKWNREATEAGGSLAERVHPLVLDGFFRVAVAAARHDLMEYLTLHIDAFLLRPETEIDAPVETLLLRYLRYLITSRQQPRVVRWFKTLLAEKKGYTPSIQVCNVVARAAADCCDGSLTMWCVESLLSDTRQSGPDNQDWLECACALAQSGLSNFKEVMETLIQNGLLVVNREEKLYMQLLHCRRTPKWREEVEKLASTHFPLSEEGTGREEYSFRNCNLVLLILQEGEHPLFLSYYRAFLRVMDATLTEEERCRWCTFSIVWATAQRGGVPDDTLRQIAKAYAKYATAAGVTTDSLHHLRSKWAALYHQYDPAFWESLVGSASRAIVPNTPRVNFTPPFARFLKRKHLIHVNRHLLSQWEKEWEHRCGRERDWVDFCREGAHREV